MPTVQMPEAPEKPEAILDKKDPRRMRSQRKDIAKTSKPSNKKKTAAKPPKEAPAYAEFNGTSASMSFESMPAISAKDAIRNERNRST